MAPSFPLQVIISAIDQLTGPLGKMEGRVAKFGKTATAAGKRLTLGITAPVVGFGVLALTTSAQFESSMKTVEALSGSTAAEMAQLETAARDLGKTTQFSAKEAAEGMGFFAQAGFDAEKILAALAPTLNLAAAAGSDLGTTADTAAKIMAGFRLEANQMERVANVLTGTFTGATTNLEELGEAFKKGGPLAKGAGFEFETTAAILGSLATAGFGGALGGTALKSSIIRLLKPSREAREALAGLRIEKKDIIDSEGNLRSLVDVIDLLGARGAGVTEVVKIFGEEAGPAMMALVSGGAQSIRDLEEKLRGVSAADVAAIKMEGLSGQLLKLKSAFDEMMLAIGDSGFLEWTTKMAEKLTGFIARLSETDPKLLKIGVIVAGLAAAIGPALIGVGALASGFGGLMTGAGLLAPVLKVVGLTLFKTVIPAVWSFTTALLANPIGLVVVGVGLLVAAGWWLVKNWDKVSAGFVKAWLFIKDKVSAVFTWLLDKIDAIFSALPDWLEKILRGGTPLGLVLKATGRTGATGDRIAEEAGAGRDASASAESKVTVAFDNVPQGVNVQADDGAQVDLDMGFAMVTGA